MNQCEASIFTQYFIQRILFT